MPGSPSPLISVITPAYNHSSYIQEAIRSIVDQDYQNLEYIIVDDGSPDDTAQKIADMSAECQKRFKNFVFLKQENQGIVRTLNRALESATGEYIFFLASDDIADRDAISTLHDFLSRHPDYSVAVPDNRIIDSQGRACYWDHVRGSVYQEEKAAFKTFAEFFQSRRPEFNFNSEDFGTYKTLIKGNYFPVGPLIKRSELLRIGGFSLRAPLEDHYMMMQISKGAKLKFIHRSLLSYRWHGNNTVSNRAKMVRMTFDTVNFEKEYCRQNGFMSDWYFMQFRFLIRLIYLEPFNFTNYTLEKFEILFMGSFAYLATRLSGKK